jgi:hypothetical protein
MPSPSHSAHQWEVISATLESVLTNRAVRSEITLERTPAPAKLASFTSALVADVDVAGDEVGSGRIVVLYEPEFQPAWDGHIRLVSYVRSELETELVMDPLLLQVGWSWVQDSFKERGIEVHALSGTVSRAGSQSFGDLAERAPEGSIEIRASWTVPHSADLGEHLLSWCDLLASAAGIEPLPEGVVSFSPPGRS